MAVTHSAEAMISGKIGVIPIPVPKPFTDSMKTVSHSWLPGGTQSKTGNHHSSHSGTRVHPILIVTHHIQHTWADERTEQDQENRSREP